MKTTNTNGTLLKDEELEFVAGGEYYSDGSHRNSEDVTFIKNIGDIVEVASGWGFGTVRCRIVDRQIGSYVDINSGIRNFAIRYYCDEYKVEPLEPHWYFYQDWVSRNSIQK